MNPKPAAVIRIYGRVQGVGFRYHTQKYARFLDVKGFVQNESDGSVLVHAEGERLDDFIQSLYQGPPRADVKNIEFLSKSAKGYTDFSIRRY